MMWIEVLLAAALLAAPARERIDRVRAVVNDEVITEHELKAALDAAGGLAPGLDHAALEKQVLDRLIDERLLEQQIKESHVHVEEADVERAIQDILKQNQISLEQLQQAIQERGMSMGAYRETLRKQLRQLKLIELKVRSKIVIPERAVKAEYARQTRGQTPDQLVHIQHIFLPWSKPSATERAATLAKLGGLRDRAERGDDFAALAKEFSKGPTAEGGGDLGEVSEKGLLPALAKGIQGLSVGQLSQPIETDTGVHLVKVLSRRAEDSGAYAKQQARIRQELYTREAEAQMKVWLEDLRSQASIDVRS